MPVITASNLARTYRLGRIEVPVLRDLDLSVEEGEWLAILGASGSGKSTLLHLLGGLDRPDRGTESSIEFQGKSLASFSPKALDRYRRTSVGFVFQFYHLLPELSVLENVTIASMIRYGRGSYGRHRSEVHERASRLLERFGLSARLRHRPAELSGGERQRVAIARALINEPTLLLADEPTGNLDRETGKEILDALAEFRADHGQTMIVVTHDPETARRADRIIQLEDGRVAQGAVGA